jgi:hypothetical protein
MVPTQGVFVAEILAMGWAALVLHSINKAVYMALSVLVLEVVSCCHFFSFLCCLLLRSAALLWMIAGSTLKVHPPGPVPATLVNILPLSLLLDWPVNLSRGPDHHLFRPYTFMFPPVLGISFGHFNP